MELEELHVLERQPGAVGHRHAVAGHRLGVGREAVERAAAAAGDEQRLAAQHDRLAARRVDAEQAGEAALLDQDVGDEELVVAGEAPVAQQLVVQRLHLEEAGLVGRQRRAREGVAAEGALRDAAVLVARPRDAPVIEQPDLVRDGVDEAPDDVLVGQEVGSLVGVPGVQVDRVALLGAQHRGGAALGAHRVRAHQLHLRDDADVHAAVEARADLDGGAQAGQSRAEDEHIVGQALSHPNLLARRPDCRRGRRARASRRRRGADRRVQPGGGRILSPGRTAQVDARRRAVVQPRRVRDVPARRDRRAESTAIGAVRRSQDGQRLRRGGCPRMVQSGERLRLCCGNC